MALRGQI